MTEQLWGGETTKAVDNFPVSGERVPVPVVRWLGPVKAAAAEGNGGLGLLDEDPAGGSPEGGAAGPPGGHHHQVPNDGFQAGPGAPSNQNANQAVANPPGAG